MALFVSGLTLFSGFGLGTLLMPAFALFFPLPVAIAATAVVHLANNLFKLALLGKFADKKIVLRFAVPAALAAVFGALLLKTISDIEPLAQYQLGSRQCSVTIVKIAIAALIAYPCRRNSSRWAAVYPVLSGGFPAIRAPCGLLFYPSWDWKNRF